jgi:hypothetical protein
MVWRLVEQLVACPEVAKVIVTLNIPEDSPKQLLEKVILLRNDLPKGFGQNHNAAFLLVSSQLYCVINPDIELTQNPFGELTSILCRQTVGLVAPLVINAAGLPEDSMRRFLTPRSMLKRIFGWSSGEYPLRYGGANITPNWVAGMFMLFKSEVYVKVNGFDETYFMYCEDADICTRIWKSGYEVFGCLSASVVHSAQRASHHSLKHLIWHLQSMSRYFIKHMFSLPKN